ncbi:MAG: hypothetical protein U9N53_08860 [Bacteroidota bacterium]|nr:hypothetical protein [Bacteroidota bacterium]
MTNKISFYQLVLIGLFISIFTILLIFNSEAYNFLSKEDHLIEYLSSVSLAITGVFFLKASIYSKKTVSGKSIKWNTFLFVVLAVVFFIAAGEEISWGQRLFNFRTPEYLSQLNDQNEFNFHNVDKKFFDRLVDRSTIAFVIICSVLVLLRKKTILGMKAPDIFTISAFAILPFYNQYNDLTLDFFHLQYIPLIALLIFSIKNKDKIYIYAVVITLIVSILIPIIHIKFNYLFPSHNNSANEYREFMFGICCLFYSYIILKKVRLDTIC